MKHLRKRLAALAATAFTATFAFLGVSVTPAHAGGVCGQPKWYICVLADNEPLTVEGMSAYDFTYEIETRYWSVVAVRPGYGSNFNLQLYNSRDHNDFLTGSYRTGSTVDFIAVDANTGGFSVGEYLYPYVYKTAGPDDASFTIEQEQGRRILGTAQQQVTLEAEDVVAIWDTYLVAGRSYRFTLKSPKRPSCNLIICFGGADGDLFLLPKAMGTVNGRSPAIPSSTSTGTGGVETITFTPTVTGYHGIVLTQASGWGGTYTLERSS